MAVLKTCACGLVYDVDTWRELAFVGVHREGGGYPDLELRNCSCGSTLCLEVRDVNSERVKT
jgi:hypothetical protein